MRLHRLQIEGFGPFLERQTVDFDAFAEDGIFLISGPTGAGKSSILDAVCFALYAGVPRYDGDARQVRSDHCRPGDPTEVTLEFTVADTRYRILRAPEYERPKKHGAGTTIAKARVELSRQEPDGTWVGVATKQAEAGRVLHGILGLTRDQFQQVILLAQGQFARFLLAGNDDRQTLLRTLFNTRRYQDYEHALDEQRKTAEREIADTTRTIGALLDEADAAIARARPTDTTPAGDTGTPAGDTATVSPPVDVPARLEAVDTAVAEGEREVGRLAGVQHDAQQARDAAAAAHERVQRLHDLAGKRRTAAAALCLLAEQEPQVVAARTELDAARRAEPLRPILDTHTGAREAAENTAAAHAVARDAWEATGGNPDETGQGLSGIIDTLTGQIALWEETARQEDTLPALARRHDGLRATVDTLQQKLDDLTGQARDIPARRRALTQQLADAHTAAAARDDLRTRERQAADRLEAARDAQDLQHTLDQAEAVLVDAAAAHWDASTAYIGLLRRRAQARAGDLAADLAPGEACPVCGSTTHPHPATAAAPVTDQQVEDAEAALEATAGRLKTAQVAADTARAAHDTASRRSAGATIQDAEAAHAEAAHFLTAAVEAAALEDRLTDDLAACDQEVDRLTGRITATGDGLHQAREEAAALTARLSDITQAVADARGAFPTVAVRIADACTRKNTAGTLRDTTVAHHAAVQAAADADATMGRHLHTAGFDTEAAARAGLRAPADQEQLDARIRTHDRDTAAQRAILADIDAALAAAPSPLPSLTDSGQKLQDTRRAADAALAATEQARHTLAALSDIAVRAHTRYAAVTNLDRRRQLVAGLADAACGRNEKRMDLETFVLAAQLEHIVQAANLRLDDMSAGRYRLAHTAALAAHGASSGLGLEIFDTYTGQTRAARSLSGGETFLASLSLALGLAQVVTDRAGGIRLDTLFIDEGFGSLDSETLQLAMSCLDKLRAGGRTVGVISHVDTIREQIPAQLTVHPTAYGSSVIQ